MGVFGKCAAEGQSETYRVLGALGSPRLSPKMPWAGAGLSGGLADSCCSQAAQKPHPAQAVLGHLTKHKEGNTEVQQMLQLPC